MTDSQSAYSSCASLEQMLTQGWKIEPPVYARPDWQSASTSREGNTYHFVLGRKNRVYLVSIRESPEIEQFLADRELPVSCL